MHQLARKHSPHREKHTSFSLVLPHRHPSLSSLLLLPCLFRGMRLAGCVWWPDSKSLSHSPNKFPPFFPFLLTWLSTPSYCFSKTSGVYSTHTNTLTHSLFGATVGAESISPLPYSFLPASPCSDLFQCVVASRVCVHLQPCPVKYRLFKEVSNIIWSLYCNYKVLLLEMAERERGRAAHSHLLSPSPELMPSLQTSLSRFHLSLKSPLLVLTQMLPHHVALSAVYQHYSQQRLFCCLIGWIVRNLFSGWPHLMERTLRETLWPLGS